MVIEFFALGIASVMAGVAKRDFLSRLDGGVLAGLALFGIHLLRDPLRTALFILNPLAFLTFLAALVLAVPDPATALGFLLIALVVLLLLAPANGILTMKCLDGNGRRSSCPSASGAIGNRFFSVL